MRPIKCCSLVDIHFIDKYSSPKGHVFYSRHLRYLNQRSLCSFIAISMNAPAIICLLPLRGPSAILRFIISIIIYSIKAFSLWPVAHILKKIIEIVPTLANFNSSATILFKSMCTFSIASLDHGIPNIINFGCIEVFLNFSHLLSSALNTLSAFSRLYMIYIPHKYSSADAFCFTSSTASFFYDLPICLFQHKRLFIFNLILIKGVNYG